MSAFKSKTVATWLALVTGGLGLHRFYLHGLTDWKGWLFPLPTFLGLLGLQRVQEFGVDDALAWWLLPLGGLALSAAMFTAIIYGLCPDERWDARHNSGTTTPSQSGWGAVIGVVLALLLGAMALMSTITVSVQRYFEASIATASQPKSP